MSIRIDNSTDLMLLAEMANISDNQSVKNNESDFYKLLAKKQLQYKGVTEVVRRIMPDGTIRVTKYSGNHVDSCYRTSPHLKNLTDTDSTPFGTWPVY